MDPVTNPPLLPAAFAGSTGAATTATDDAAAAAASDFDSFLRLLTAQLENQDPLQPLDSTEFVAQLASFSSVEQLIGVNERLDALSDQAGAETAAVLSDWIGREVSTIDGRFRADGAPLTLDVPAEAGATAALVALRRLDGNAVREIALPTGRGAVTWDGLSAEGASLAGEDLIADVTYFDGETEVARRPLAIYREVVALESGAAGPTLQLADGTRLAPERIAGLRQATETQE